MKCYLILLGTKYNKTDPRIGKQEWLCLIQEKKAPQKL